MLEYSMHRFQNRSHRWVLDAFKYKQTVNLTLRTIEKLCFSSQFYFFVMGMSLSLIVMLQGVIIMMHNSYNLYNDPAFLGVLVCVIILGRILELFISYVSVKSKLYQLKNEKNKAKLDSISFFRRKENYDSYL
jgi:hypothetical protein